jgi:hypothetical protein
MEIWEEQGYAGIVNDGDPNHACFFNPERGTGQGDVSSPHTWTVFFDIILRTLELETEDSFELVAPDGSTHRAPDTAYADDLISLAATRSGLQRKADVVSACAIILGLKIAHNKLRVFSMDWTATAEQRKQAPLEVLTVHSMGWIPHVIPINQGGSVKSLGVHYDMDISGTTQRELSTTELKGLLAACRHRKASPDTIKAVLETSVLSKIAYRGVLSG